MFHVVLNNGKSFVADESKSILDSARLGGITLEYSCRTGRCGVCVAPVLRGETQRLRAEESLTREQSAAGLILTCCRSAGSDLELDVEDLGRLTDVPVRTLPCRIASIEFPASTIAKISLRLPPNVAFRFLPGQFVDVIAAGHRRSYSIANAPRPDDVIELVIRKVEGGALSEYWFGSAKVNDLLRFEGPLGTFFLRNGDASPLVLLATGSGIAPVRAITQELAGSGQIDARDIRIYWGNRMSEDFFLDFGREFPGVAVTPVLSGEDRTWVGKRGRIQQALLEDLSEFGEASVYACGSEAMIHDAERMLLNAGLSRGKFFSDAFLSTN